MSEFKKASTQRINGFPIGGRVYFKHYFDDRDIFSELSSYYNSSEYRFELPMDALPEVRGFLDDEGYGLVVVSEPREFAVVKRKFTEHPDSIFRNSVVMRDTSDFHVFLMKDRDAVEQALINGASRLSSTDLDIEF